MLIESDRFYLQEEFSVKSNQRCPGNHTPPPFETQDIRTQGEVAVEMRGDEAVPDPETPQGE